MNGFEDVLAVGGFWLCMILLIFRGAIKDKLLAPAPKNSNEIAEMKIRLAALEARLASVNTELLELREIQDFDKKLLGKPGARQITSSPVSLERPKLPLK